MIYIFLTVIIILLIIMMRKKKIQDKEAELQAALMGVNTIFFVKFNQEEESYIVDFSLFDIYKIVTVEVHSKVLDAQDYAFADVCNFYQYDDYTWLWDFQKGG